MRHSLLPCASTGSRLISITKKQQVGEAAADLVEDGMVLGLGSGSTVVCFLEALARRVAAGLNVSGVPSSSGTARLAEELGIPLTDFTHVRRLDLCIDGADEVDPALSMIKGGGGALLREKIVAQASARCVFIVDESKMVETLGRFPLPIEVTRFGHERILHALRDQGLEVRLRLVENEYFVTDSGHMIIDCRYGKIVDPAALEAELSGLAGVVENGLFVGLADQVLCATDNGVVVYPR